VQILLWTSRGCIYFASLAASRRLFDALLATVLGAPMRFHEATPRGRILNRFNEDISAVDSGLVAVLDKTIEAGFVVVSSFIGVSVGSGGLTFLLATALLSPAYIILGGAYAAAARDARRLASTSTSPVVSTFSDLISGAAVVRAFGASKHGMAALMRRLDEANSYTVWVPHLQRW
jgi:ABC-type multidrug transport system fused ATPase/permease subunit